jgi:hypothetical protein
VHGGSAIVLLPPAGGVDGFEGGPQYIYPGYDALPEPFAYDRHDYPRFHTSWRERLPTQDMLARALPEGVVQDGGEVAGFTYYGSVTGRESAVEFEMTLVDARDGQTFGHVAIPFRITRS